MTIFVFFADEEHKRRADCRNTIVAAGTDEASARAAAEALIAEPDGLASFRAVPFTDDTPAFVVEGHKPVGARDQATWPSMTRGGDWLGGL